MVAPDQRWLAAPGFEQLLADAGAPVRIDGAEVLVPTRRAFVPHAVASVLVATYDGRVLLGRNKSGGWGTLGGHIDDTDTTAASAAARELGEEAGLLVDPALLDPLSVAVDEREFRPGCQHIDLCFALVMAVEPDAAAASDISALAWFDIEQPPDLNDHMRTHVDALAALLRRRRAGDS